MKRLLILVTFLGLTVHFCDVQGSAEISQEALDRQLIEAASSGIDLVKIRNLINAGANVNAVNQYGETALMRAVRGGHREVVELLLQEGATNVNAADRDRETVLMRAARGGHREVVELLLQEGANVNAVDHTGIISN